MTRVGARAKTCQKLLGKDLQNLKIKTFYQNIKSNLILTVDSESGRNSDLN